MQVQVFLYDLSQGMARAMSQSLAGRQIDGIWHTSVVVYGREFAFGQGIEEFVPGRAPHGPIVERIDMGVTGIPEDVFMEYLDNMRSVWTADKYHVLDNNCNNFSDEVCQFLVGKGIPSHITSLPADFMNTPFGQSLLPMIEGMFGPSRHNSNPQLNQTAAPQRSGQSPVSAGDLMSALSGLAGMPGMSGLGGLGGMSGMNGMNGMNGMAGMAGAPSMPSASAASTTSRADHPIAHVKPCTGLAEFRSLLATHRAVAVDFTSATCGPCRVISPEFDRLITEANETFRPLGVQNLPTAPILGLSVEVGIARELAAAYKIAATPTFMFFLDGKQFHEFRGADRSELKSSIDLLLFTAYPAHPHAKFSLSSLADLRDSEPVRFVQSSNLDAIFNKLKTFATEGKVAWDDAAAQRLLVWMKAAGASSKTPLASVAGWQTFLSNLLVQLPVNQLFPVLDIVRLLVTQDPAACVFFLSQDPAHSLVAVMDKVVQNAETAGKPTRLMLLRLGCNLFTKADPSVPLARLADARTLFTSVVVDHLLSPELQLRQASALLVFNVAWSVTLLRPAADPATAAAAFAEFDEGWASELVAAICNAIDAEASLGANGDDDIALRLVSALGLLLAFAPTSIAELAQVVGAGEHLQTMTAHRNAAIKTLNGSLAAMADNKDGVAAARKTIEKKKWLVKTAKEVTDLLSIVQ